MNRRIGSEPCDRMLKHECHDVCSEVRGLHLAHVDAQSSAWELGADDLSSTALNWYVIQAKPKQEERADENLRGWNVDTLLPKLLRPARSARGSRTRIEPLFPGYLFARFDAGEMLSKMRYTRGVAKILGTAEGPTPLDDGVIEMIKERMDASGIVSLSASLRPGDRVRVIGGPFKEFLGVFEHTTTTAQRVTLLLAALNTQVRVVLDARLVERVS